MKIDIILLRPISRALSISNSHRAAMDMVSNPQNLPKLPVPPLRKTLDKFVKSAKPHLNKNELDNTIKAADNFEKSETGKKLQSILEQRALVKRNWLEEWWLNAAYLEYRNPLVIYSNPGLVMPFLTFKNEEEYLRYVSRSIFRIIAFQQFVDRKEIPIERFGNDELDMSQYYRMMGTCRVPTPKRDVLKFSNCKHITVLHNGHIFILSTVDVDGVQLNESQLSTLLKKIISLSTEENPSPVGILTSEHRDTWADLYIKLSQDKRNRQSLEMIEKSSFVVCLDKNIFDEYQNDKSKKQTTALNFCIHGGGSSKNTCNRWFDKSLQLVASRDGFSGMVDEHSPAEGQPVAVLLDYMFKEDLTEYKNYSKKVTQPVKLEFHLTSEIKQAIESAKKNIDKIIDTLLLNCFTFRDFGKGFIKSQKLSPDSFVQIALQAAFYKLHGIPAAQYESAATRKFIGGRTETIRSCSEEAVYFSKILFDTSVSSRDKIEVLKKAIQAHKTYAYQAINGEGIDRHFLGLKLAALENGIELPEFFNDDGFKRSSYMRLSTSQVSTKCDAIMGYCPLVPDGYAICYNPHENSMNIGISAFRNKDSNLDAYCDSLRQCLNQMRHILVHSADSKL